MENVTGLNVIPKTWVYMINMGGRGAFLSAVKLDWKVQWSVRK